MVVVKDRIVRKIRGPIICASVLMRSATMPPSEHAFLRCSTFGPGEERERERKGVIRRRAAGASDVFCSIGANNRVKEGF